MKLEQRMNYDEGGILVKLFSNYVIGTMKRKILPQARIQGMLRMLQIG